VKSQVDTSLLHIGMARYEQFLWSKVSACYLDTPLSLFLLDLTDPIVDTLKKTRFLTGLNNI